MSEGELLTCGQCKRIHSSQNEVFVDTCGHKKCRECQQRLGEKCFQCSVQKNQYKSPTKKKDSNAKISQQTHIVEESSSETGEIRYRCTAPNCGKVFRSRTQKYYHLQCNELNNKLHECDICKKTFSRLSQLKYHKESHTSPHNECLMCQKIFLNPLALKKHEALHKVEPKQCTQCDKTFLKKSSLEEHIAAQHLHQLQYGCAYCNKKYASKSSLQLHLQSHEAKRFECPYCGKFFQRNSILNLHIKRHYHTNSFKCQLCEKVFTELAALSRHHKIHEENVLQYHCKLCDKHILRKDNMTRHVNTIHPDDSYDDIVQVIRPYATESIDEIMPEHNQTAVDNVSIFVDEELSKFNKIQLTAKSERLFIEPYSIKEQNHDNKCENIVIIENKLLQKPLESVRLHNDDIFYEEKYTNVKRNNYDENVLVEKNIETFVESPLLSNQIQVITALPETSNLTTNSSENVPTCLTYYNLDAKNYVSHVDISLQQHDFHSKDNVFGQKHNHIQPHNDCSSLEFQETDPPQINANKIENNITLSNEYLPNFDYSISNKYSVIRSIGNVKQKLSIHAPIENNTISNNSQDYDYKHKKYNHHYNVDLYRKILGCDDDNDNLNDDDNEEINSDIEHTSSNTRSEKQEDSYNMQLDALSETSNTAPVHWRKSFKNIYETSTL